MKFMMCGKGGAGKSTVAARLAKELAHAGQRVVVVDTDVSSVLGPSRQLGLAPPPDLIEYFGGEHVVRERLRSLDALAVTPHTPVSSIHALMAGHVRAEETPRQQPLLGTWNFDSIPASHHSVMGAIQLVTIGKLRDVKISCKSPWLGLCRQFVLGLTPTASEHVIVDSEAGIEHIGRGIDTVCDLTLMVVDPSHESIRLVERTLQMARLVQAPVYFILNKTQTDSARFLRNLIADESRILGELPLDADVLHGGLAGIPLPGNYPPMAVVLQRLAQILGAGYASQPTAPQAAH